MAEVLNLYLDDSGVRDPHRSADGNPEDRWFALGGVLVWERDRFELERRHRDFCREWRIQAPLHMTEIQAGKGGFRWLDPRSSAKRERFLKSLTTWMGELPVLGHSCVIHRDGYQQRYRHYGDGMWHLCRTAFSVVVERAAKYAIAKKARLRVDVERCGEREDRFIEGYFEDLKSGGMPFAGDTSGKYRPLSATELASCLYDFRKSGKRAATMQVADLFLWHVCRKAFQDEPRFDELGAAGRWIDCTLASSDIPTMGIKYSCFPEASKKQNPATAGFCRPPTTQGDPVGYAQVN